MFRDLFDPLIRVRFNHGPDARQYHDIDVTKLQYPLESDDINKYILSSRLRITRNLSGHTFPTFSTRAERRDVEGKFSKIFAQFIQAHSQFQGNYYCLSTIDERLQETLANVSTSMLGEVNSKENLLLHRCVH